MTANVEIKARCGDLPALRERVKAIATGYVGVDRQQDTYFATPHGRLKLRESSLSGAQLVPYLRPDRAGPKRSDYRVIPVPDPPGTKRLLALLLGLHRVVRKEREIFLWQNVRIHLDQVEGLGTFVELEAVYDGSQPAEQRQLDNVRWLTDKLGIRSDDLVAMSYEGLLEGWSPATRREGRSLSLRRLIGKLHRWVYEASGGRIGARMGHRHMLLLTTTGRRTGRAHTLPLTYLLDGEDLVVFASGRARAQQPSWFLNLRENPRAHVQVGRESFDVTASVATPVDQARLWPKFQDHGRPFPRNEKKTPREIPVLILRRF